MAENLMEKEGDYIGYKITTGKTYRVYVNSAKGVNYYKVQIKKKNYDGTENSFYKQLRFAKCTPPEDGDIIKIKKGFEDLYVNNVDKYNPISVIVVMEYEKVDNPVVNQDKAFQEYQQAISEENTTVQDSDLPF